MAQERLASLDAFRGFTMFWLAGGATFIRSFQKAVESPAVAAVANQFDHSYWEGLRFWDVVMPSFLLMVGMSVPFAYARRAAEESHGRILLHAFRRAAILFLLGSFRESISLGSPFLIELSSALQPIAVSYLVCVLLVRSRWWVQAAVGALFLAVPGLIMALVPAPGIPAGTYSHESNLCFWLDMAVLGRTHRDVWGTVLTETLIPATAIVGMLIGRLLLSERDRMKKLGAIFAIGAGCIAAGLALSPVVPVIMRIWTASYGILSAGVACVLFGVFFWIIDVRGWRRWAFPFTVIGLNAIAAYMLPTVIPVSRHMGILTKDVVAHMGAWGPVFRAFAVMAVEWLILYWMYRRKLFLRP